MDVDRLFSQHPAGFAVPWLDLRRGADGGLTAVGQALPEGTEARGDEDGVTLTWQPSRHSRFTQRVERDGTQVYEHCGMVDQVRITFRSDGASETLTRFGDDRPWASDETSRVVEDGWIQIGERAKFKLLVDPTRVRPGAELPAAHSAAPEGVPITIVMGPHEVGIGGVILPVRG